MEKLLDWLWTPLVGLFAALYAKAHRNSTNIEVLIQTQEMLMDQIRASEHARERVHDKIESVRKELASQHAVLREEQRSDMKEIRESLSTLHCKTGTH